MSYGIGIDTGGTYTDAVIYDFGTKRILSSAKSLTTRQDLSIGICGALDGLDASLLSCCDVVALSTTLATNACVEGKGGRAGLVLIGVDRRVVEKVGGEYGLPPVKDIIFIDSKGNLDGEILQEPDWDALRARRDDLLSFDSVGIVELFAMRNGAVLEKKAREILRDEMGISAVCGHEMFSDLNSVRRGAGTLLNARLIPIISEFLEAVEKSLAARGISCPVVVVRSDGSLMSRDFTHLRPVETLLCGPAASVMGGQELTGHPDSVIIDMGGTTTDIAVIEDGQAVRDNDGISIGGWKTYVKGLYINTFGLGGDSAVRYTEEAKLYLDSRRVIPLCIASSSHPAVRSELERLLDEGKTHTHFLHEFYIRLKDISGQSGYSAEEQALSNSLADGPLSYRQAAAFFGDVYRMNTKRLEERGVVIRCGLTPTDIMHIKGDFDTYDRTASELGAHYVSRCLNVEPDELCDMVYDEVCRKLYCGITNMLLTDSRFGGHPGADYRALVNKAWDERHCGGEKLLSASFRTKAALVGIGAPIHIFLPRVAEALGTVCSVPSHAGVANALGAVVGRINAEYSVVVKPSFTPDGADSFTVFGYSGNTVHESLEDAVAQAKLEAGRGAVEQARARGASGEISVSLKEDEHSAPIKGGVIIHLSTTVTATAIGGRNG